MLNSYDGMLLAAGSHSRERESFNEADLGSNRVEE
jgi:hypothetical protein